MAKEIAVLDLQGKKDSRMKIPSWLLLKMNQKVLHQALVYFEHLKIIPTAHTKTRGEVRGGGRKPWRQKGTGRARAGSIRSPIFRGGGVIFGPHPDLKPQDRIHKKIRRLALYMGLSAKLKSEKLKVIKPIKIEKINTNKFFRIFEKLISQNKNILFVDEKFLDSTKKSARNLQRFNLKDIRFVNVGDILKHDLVILSKDAINYLDEQAEKLGVVKKP